MCCSIHRFLDCYIFFVFLNFCVNIFVQGHSLLEVVEVDGRKCSLYTIPLTRSGRRLLGQTTMQGEGKTCLLTLCMYINNEFKVSDPKQENVPNLTYFILVSILCKTVPLFNRE